ncbi:MAG: hypothetical protein AAGN66_17210 [Acidobacteriota bacterium]
MTRDDPLRDLVEELAAEEVAARGDDPITAADLVALRAGELDDERAEFVMEVVATDDAWAAALLDLARFEEGSGGSTEDGDPQDGDPREPFPAEVDRSEVDPAEVEREWNRLSAALEPEVEPPLPFPRRLPFVRRLRAGALGRLSLAAMAGSLVTFLALLPFDPPAGTGLDETRSFAVLAPETGESTRNGSANSVDPGPFDIWVLRLQLPDGADVRKEETGLRAILQREGTEEVILTRKANTDGDYNVIFEIPRKRLREGPHRIILIHTLPEGDQELATYRFRVVDDEP